VCKKGLPNSSLLRKRIRDWARGKPRVFVAAARHSPSAAIQGRTVAEHCCAQLSRAHWIGPLTWDRPNRGVYRGVGKARAWQGQSLVRPEPGKAKPDFRPSIEFPGVWWVFLLKKRHFWCTLTWLEFDFEPAQLDASDTKSIRFSACSNSSFL